VHPPFQSSFIGQAARERTVDWKNARTTTLVAMRISNVIDQPKVAPRKAKPRLRKRGPRTVARTEWPKETYSSCSARRVSLSLSQIKEEWKEKLEEIVKQDC
jgi:hypothetical protein